MSQGADGSAPAIASQTLFTVNWMSPSELDWVMTGFAATAMENRVA